MHNRRFIFETFPESGKVAVVRHPGSAKIIGKELLLSYSAELSGRANKVEILKKRVFSDPSRNSKPVLAQIRTLRLDLTDLLYVSGYF